MAQNKKSGGSGRKNGSSSASGSTRKKTGTGRSSSTKRAASSRNKTAAGRNRQAASGRKSGSSAASRRSAAVAKARRQKQTRERGIRMDIAFVVLLVSMIFLYASLAGYCGLVGKTLCDMMFGFFGIGAWVLPVWIFVLCVYLIRQKRSAQMPVRMLAGAMLILVLQSVGHLNLHMKLVTSLDTPYSIKNVFSLCAMNHAGGGIIGGWFARIMYRAFGLPGSVLAYIAITVIALMLLAQRSPAGLYRSWLDYREEEGIPGFSERKAMRRERRERRLQQMEEEEEERLQREAERILRREDRAAEKARQRAESAGRPSSGSKRSRVKSGSLDLENMVVDGRSGKKKISQNSSSAYLDDSFRNSRSDRNYAENRRRDVHEIIVYPDPEEDENILTAAGPARAAAGVAAAGSAISAAGTGASGFAMPEDDPETQSSSVREIFSPLQRTEDVYGRAEPGGTTYRRPADFESGISKQDGVYDGANSNAGRSVMENAIDGSGNAAAKSTVKGAAGTGEGAGESTSARGAAPVSASGAEPAQGSGTGTDLPSEEDLQGIAVHRDDSNGRSGSKAAGRTAVAHRGTSYVPPTFSLLERGSSSRNDETERELRETAYRLQETLRTFGVQVTITDISQGPSVTRYELKPDKGVKVSKIVNLSDDIKLRLAATDIRIEAPIPGKSAIGIEVPNKRETTVHLRELLESREFRRFEGKLPFAVGKDIGGKTVIADISRMPHLLIAGATGSGKSVCINTIILSILYRTSPDKVRLLMIDPKVVELSVYKKIPHLIIPVVTDARKASAALNWAVAEMEKRYKLFAAAGVRDLNGYNALARSYVGEDGEPEREPMPRIVIIVDELADLMMVAKSEVESAICRLAQLARAAGIHLIIATQRPSVDVITGLIKANMPSRIAFAVSSQVDSRTILDMAGAEKLIGRGDMLFYPQNYQKPARIQGAFVSDDEVSNVVDYIKKHNAEETHDEEVDRQIEDIAVNGISGSSQAEVKPDPGRDEYFVEAGRFIIEKNKASIGLLQRVFKIGFNRAARIMDQLAEAGVVSEESSTRARQVLMTMPEFEAYLNE